MLVPRFTFLSTLFPLIVSFSPKNQHQHYRYHYHYPHLVSRMSSTKKTTFSALQPDVQNISDNDISADASLDDDAADHETNLSPPNSKLARGKHRRSRSLTMNRPTIPLGTPLGKIIALEQAQVEIDVQEPPSKLASTVQARRKRKSFHYTIRPMKLKDISTVYQLGNSIFTASEFPNMYRTWDDFTVLENFGGNPDFCFVAEHGNAEDASQQQVTTTIGFLLGGIMTKSNVGSRGYIQWVAIPPAYRRHGVATKLIQSFTQVAKEQNISLLLADTPKDNSPAVGMFEKAGLCGKADHVYLTCQMPKGTKLENVDQDGTFNFMYNVKKKRITIRNMEIHDLHPIYLIGEQIFTEKSPNLYNFWDEHLVLHSYLSDPEYCVVATVREEDGNEQVVGFCFGTTIDKPRSSWKYGYLVWLGCAADFQGFGLASQLYNTMLELFLLQKCRILMVDTQQNNDGALQFFRKKGFGHDEEHVYLSNNPPKKKEK
jgi:ribosomal protein S18 acetylase RimI-like enzyme